MRKKQIAVQVFLMMLFCLFSVLINPKVVSAAEEDVITKGVYIDSVDISGLNKEEAQMAVTEYVDSLKSKTLTVTVEDNSETITLGELGFQYEDNTYIEDALKIGKSGNLIKRYKELKDTEQGTLVYKLEFKLDNEKVKNFIKEKISQYAVEAVNAKVSRENGEFVYTDEVVGTKINTSETINQIESEILNGWNQEDIVISASIEKDIPKYTRKMVEQCNTILGTFSTTYTTSSSNRAGNLANGARLINNTVLYPGDTFSAYEKLTPFTTANGYYEAGAYSNGMLVDSIGGGVCQVTTTLYNAVLFAELEVVERYAHSMTISYVELSRDAAIAGTWKDLKFSNSTDSPILIEAYTEGRTITFNIWGHETRDTQNRKLKFESVVLSQTQPGKDVVKEDPTKPVGYKEVTQSAHIGYVAELYKVVYENGDEVSRTKVNKSVYNASPRYVTVGTKEEEKKETEDKNKKETSKGKKSNKSTPVSGSNIKNSPINEKSHDNYDDTSSYEEEDDFTPDEDYNVDDDYDYEYEEETEDFY